MAKFARVSERRKLKTAAGAAVRISLQTEETYFLSSPKGGGAVVTVGGFAGGAGFGGFC